MNISSFTKEEYLRISAHFYNHQMVIGRLAHIIDSDEFKTDREKVEGCKEVIEQCWEEVERIGKTDFSKVEFSK